MAPPPLKILSQESKYGTAQTGGGRLIEISGEVMNVSPTGEVFNVGNGEYVCIIITLYDANSQTVGNGTGLIDVSDIGMQPNQIQLQYLPSEDEGNNDKGTYHTEQSYE